MLMLSCKIFTTVDPGVAIWLSHANQLLREAVFKAARMLSEYVATSFFHISKGILVIKIVQPHWGDHQQT